MYIYFMVTYTLEDLLIGKVHYSESRQASGEIVQAVRVDDEIIKIEWREDFGRGIYRYHWSTIQVNR